MKAQHEGALTPPCIIRKNPQGLHTARQVGNACGGKPGSHGSKAILLSHAPPSPSDGLVPSPQHPPLHPDGFRPPQLLLPGLVELSDDLFCLLGRETEKNEIRVGGRQCTEAWVPGKGEMSSQGPTPQFWSI